MLHSESTLPALSRAFAIESGLAEEPSLEFRFQQLWQKEGQGSFLPAHVALYPRATGLTIIASLSDREIYSDATEMSQPMWRMGDVFEIFIGVPGEAEYRELHITPNNHRLQVLWTEQAFASYRKKESVLSDHIITDPELFMSTTRVHSAEGYWQIYVFLPWASVGLPDACNSYSLELAFCRYDSTRSGEPLVLSSTVLFDKKNFHARGQWSKVTFSPVGR